MRTLSSEDLQSGPGSPCQPTHLGRCPCRACLEFATRGLTPVGARTPCVRQGHRGAAVGQQCLQQLPVNYECTGQGIIDTQGAAPRCTNRPRKTQEQAAGLRLAERPKWRHSWGPRPCMRFVQVVRDNNPRPAHSSKTAGSWSADARLGMGLALLFAGASACACLKRRGHEGGGRDPCLTASDTIITPFIQ